MSRFREEIGLIPKTAWVIAALVYVAAVILIVGLLFQQKPEPYNWPLAAKVPFAVLVPLPGTILVLLIGYVNRDAKRRQMRYVLWTLLAIFIPQGIGIILYFILRDPVPSSCPACAAVLSPSFTFCPHCGTATKPTCPQCEKPIERNWANCAYCGRKLAAPSTHAA
jgi:hypothetical protein